MISDEKVGGVIMLSVTRNTVIILWAIFLGIHFLEDIWGDGSLVLKHGDYTELEEHEWRTIMGDSWRITLTKNNRITGSNLSYFLPQFPFYLA